MNSFLTILKKEFKRIFTDYRMYFALFLPGILIFVLYSFLGNMISSNIVNQQYKDVTYRVAYSDNFNTKDPTSSPLLRFALDEYLKIDEGEKTNKVEYFTFKQSELEDYKLKTKNAEYHLVISFTDNFDNQVFVPNLTKPNIDIFYNGGDGISTHIYQIASSLVPSIYNNYSQNIKGDEFLNPNLSDEDFIAQSVLGFLFPMLTISMLFSSVMALCPETIAGEKERGTLTSLLITPTKRTSIVLAKVTCLSVTSLLSGIVSASGIILSIPKLMNGAQFTFTGTSIVLLFLLIMSSLFLFVLIGTLCSTLAKSVKEATSYLGPFVGILMVLCFLPAVTNMSNIGMSFIPFLNLSTSMNMVISASNIDYTFLACTIVSNIIYSLGLVLLVAKLFNTERIIMKN